MGDFNRHHPYWDNPSNLRLFTDSATVAAELLIEVVEEARLEMALPSGIPTHCHSITKWWTRLDNVFISENSTDMVIACNALTEHRGINTDHVLILMELDMGIVMNDIKPIPNFREVDWDEFHKALARHLGPVQAEEQIISQRQLDARCGNLTEAIQSAIQEQVLVMEITPKSKQW